jgi:lipopolysaccharide export system ATP-binding protein
MTDDNLTPQPATVTDPAVEMVLQIVRGDRALAPVLGAVVEVADGDGVALVHAIVSRFRDARLEQLELEGRDVVHEAERLTLEGVRSALATTLLPRLAGTGAIELPPGNLDNPESALRIAPDIWAQLSPLRAGLTRRLRETGEHFSVRLSQPRGVPALENPSVLSADKLIKSYRGRRVVNDVSVNVRQGEIVGLLGPNGAGKTTTFYMLVGLIAPQSGRIQLDGRDVTSMPMYERARQGIGYLSQEPSIFRKLTVEQNILAILETLPLSGADRKARLESLLRELGLERLRKSRAFQLSGGERRRLEITRALVTEPKFMMLDEPFAGVDPIAVHDIQSIVADLRTRGIGVLISDHNVEQTLDIVDRAYIMFDGQVKVSGTVRELVFDDTVAEIYLGPTLTARLRARFAEADEGVLTE